MVLLSCVQSLSNGFGHRFEKVQVEITSTNNEESKSTSIIGVSWAMKDMIHHFVEHRHEVVVRRTKYELRKAEDRAHILEGLIIASWGY